MQKEIIISGSDYTGFGLVCQCWRLIVPLNMDDFESLSSDED